MAALKRLRRDLLARVAAFPESDLARSGRHPAFGLMTVPWWLEHFLLHEAHHLYGVLVCTRAALAENRDP
jgi:hypothetical protein